MFGSNDEGRVISLAARRDPSSENGGFAELETYWTALAAGRLMPYRDQIDPRGVEGTLDRIFLLERIGAGIARFRIAGQGVTDAMGMEMRGLPISAIFSPAARETLDDSLRALFDGPARVEIALAAPRQGLRGRTELRMLLLPLRDRMGDVSRAIGAITPVARPAKATQRFEIDNVSRKALTGVDATDGKAEDDHFFDAAEAAMVRVREAEERRLAFRVVRPSPPNISN